MLGENSEMGILSSVLHTVEPLALTPLGGHPLYDYQMLYSGLCYFSSLLFSIIFLISAFEFLPHDVQVLSLAGYMSVSSAFGVEIALV